MQVDERDRDRERAGARDVELELQSLQVTRGYLLHSSHAIETIDCILLYQPPRSGLLDPAWPQPNYIYLAKPT